MQLDSPQIAEQRDMPARGRDLHRSGRGPALEAGGTAGAHVQRACRTSRCGRATWRSALAVVILAAGVWASVAAGRDGRRREPTGAGGSMRSATGCSPSWPRSRSSTAPARVDARPLRDAARRAGGGARAHLRRAGRGAAAALSVTRRMDFTSLTFADVSRHFGRRRALNRVSFRCEAGEIVALLGPNGAGKSTLLSIAATLLAPSSGDGALRRAPRADAGGARCAARIGVLGHDLYLYPELTAAENLRFFGRLYGLPDVERARRRGARARRARRRGATMPVVRLLARHAAAAGARARAAARAAAGAARRAVHRPRRRRDGGAARRGCATCARPGCIVAR